MPNKETVRLEVLERENRRLQRAVDELSIIAAQSARVVENARLYEEQAEILRVFGQHTAPEVVEALLQTGPALHSRRQRVCVKRKGDRPEIKK